MSQAQFTFPDPVILNRYAHIYILKIFYFLTGSPITGARVFWCFMFFGTSVLTYWSAKILAGKKGSGCSGQTFGHSPDQGQCAASRR
jgi:hypothetical protein